MSKNQAHHLNEYYNYEELSATQKLTKQKILRDEKLTSKEIDILCRGFLVNAIYASFVENSQNFAQAREEAFTVAAQIIIEHGEEIEEQLKENDSAELTTQNNSTISQNTNQEQSQSNQNQPNTSEDSKKISGSSMAKIISKISEIMAVMSPEERKAAAANFGALFVVLGTSFDKMDQSISELACTPVVLANIKDILEGTRGEEVFNEIITTHLKPSEKEALNESMKEDLAEYRKEMRQQRSSAVFVRL